MAGDRCVCFGVFTYGALECRAVQVGASGLCIGGKQGFAQHGGPVFLTALDAPELALTPGGDDKGTPDSVAHLPHGIVLVSSGEGRGSGLDRLG